MERRGRCWEYDGETGRQAQLQAGLFETSLVALSIPWVDGQSVGENSCWVGEKGVACQRRDAACHRLAIPTLVPSKYGILPSGSRVFPTIRIFFPCCRSPTSSTPPKDAYTHLGHIAKSSSFHTDRNGLFLVEHIEVPVDGLTLHNTRWVSTFLNLTSTHATWSYHSCRRCPLLQALRVHLQVRA